MKQQIFSFIPKGRGKRRLIIEISCRCRIPWVQAKLRGDLGGYTEDEVIDNVPIDYIWINSTQGLAGVLTTLYHELLHWRSYVMERNGEVFSKNKDILVHTLTKVVDDIYRDLVKKII